MTVSGLLANRSSVWHISVISSSWKNKQKHTIINHKQLNYREHVLNLISVHPKGLLEDNFIQLRMHMYAHKPQERTTMQSSKCLSFQAN